MWKTEKFLEASTLHLAQHCWSLCIFVDSILFFFLVMCTLYSRHNRRHGDIAINIGSCFQGTRTADFPHLGFLERSSTTSTLSIVRFHFKESSCNLHSKGGDLPTLSPILIPLPFQATLVVPSVGVWLFQKREGLAQASDFCGIWKQQESFPR